MSIEHTLPMNLSAPNLINICIDEERNGEITGRMYHYYSSEPARFSSVLQLVRLAERLFDGIAFPQASTRSRSFQKLSEPEAPYNVQLPEKQLTASELAGQRGKLVTVLTRVSYRQNSTWQGEAVWVERGEKRQFQTELELLRLLKLALQECENHVKNEEK